MRGMATAAREEWPGTRLQRCLVHVQRDTRRDLTTRPQSQAGRELRKLSLKLTKIRTAEQAGTWAEALNAWHERWRHLINERSTAKSDPHHPKALAGRSWWWTHERLRRAYTRMEKLFRNGQLFACLDPRLLEGGPVPGTTNRLEGGVNSPIKRVLSNHRGMIQAHMMRACELECYMRSPSPDLKALPDRFERQGRARAAIRAKQKQDAIQATGDEPAAGTAISWNELHASTPYPDSTS
jgi:hypothetical protein